MRKGVKDWNPMMPQMLLRIISCRYATVKNKYSF